MSDLTTKSLTELAALIQTREVSPVEVLEAHLDRIVRLNPALNAIVTLAPDAIEKAREAEAAIMRGDEAGPLHGVPVTIKDTIETKDLRTTAGSRVRENYVPVEDAPVVARLRKAGAIIIGKSNCSEMAAGYDTENPVFGRANNPYDPMRTPGGSSGGEAAAISSCLSPGGIGSDLMGSIRVPSHFCGIVGLKPTTGRVPYTGHIPLAEGPASLGAVIGPMARRVEDVALLFRAIAGFEETESMSAPSIDRWDRVDLAGCQVAWYVSDGVSPVSKETQHAVESAGEALADTGLKVSEQSPPGIDSADDLWPTLFACAALVQMREEYAEREDEAGPLVRYILDSATTVRAPSLSEYTLAWVERDRLRRRLVAWMKDFPLIVAPVGGIPAYEHGKREVEIEGRSISTFKTFSYSRAYNVFGLPSVCVPAGLSSEGLPLGVQIVGRPFAETHVLAAARIVEKALGGWRMPQIDPSINSTVRL
jgi:amidase